MLTKTDLKLVEMLFDDSYGVKVVHEDGDTRLADDVLDAVEELTYRYSDLKEEIDIRDEALQESESEKNNMMKHIRKLERMLLQRNVKFKTYDETYY